MSRHIRYLGFVVHDEHREYTLTMRDTDADAAWHRVTVLITHAAFKAHRVRYQDAPDICFRKLSREADSCEGWTPSVPLWIDDEDLSSYSASMAPKRPTRRRARPAVD